MVRFLCFKVRVELWVDDRGFRGVLVSCATREGFFGEGLCRLGSEHLGFFWCRGPNPRIVKIEGFIGE